MTSITYTIPGWVYPLSRGFRKSIFKKKAVVGIGISFFVVIGIFFTRHSIFVDSKSKNEDREWMIE